MSNTTVYVAYNEQDKYIVEYISGEYVKLPVDELSLDCLENPFTTYSEAQEHINYMQRTRPIFKGCFPLAIKVNLEIVE